nr:hypothetical conserved protein [Candidatus Acetothermum autotrophicum]
MEAQTADRLYTKVVRRLPLKERLRLAALILNDVIPVVDESTTWSEEDLHDVVRASLRYGTEAPDKN